LPQKGQKKEALIKYYDVKSGFAADNSDHYLQMLTGIVGLAENRSWHLPRSLRVPQHGSDDVESDDVEMYVRHFGRHRGADVVGRIRA
jgi:hypothetical protein